MNNLLLYAMEKNEVEVAICFGDYDDNRFEDVTFLVSNEKDVNKAIDRVRALIQEIRM